MTHKERLQAIHRWCMAEDEWAQADRVYPLLRELLEAMTSPTHCTCDGHPECEECGKWKSWRKLLRELKELEEQA